MKTGFLPSAVASAANRTLPPATIKTKPKIATAMASQPCEKVVARDSTARS
jgi:hypothetical protein